MLDKRNAIVAVLIGCVVLSAGHAWAGIESDVPSKALFSSPGLCGMSAGIHAGWDNREIVVGGEVADIGLKHLTARLGLPLRPEVNAYVFAGRCSATLDAADGSDEDGEGGLEWGVGALVRCFEHVLDATPVAGKKETIDISVEVRYLAGGSEFERADVEWTEVSVSPLLAYQRYYLADDLSHRPDPYGVRLCGGLTYSDLDGSLGDRDFRGNRDFGLKLSADYSIVGGWTCRVDGNFFRTGDNELSIGLLHAF